MKTFISCLCLSHTYDPASVITVHFTGLSKDYVKCVTPAEQPPPPPPVWKRSPAEWERDRIELAKLDYGKQALRYQEVPPYFETAQGLLSRKDVFVGWLISS
jgi:hypothetical protein